MRKNKHLEERIQNFQKTQEHLQNQTFEHEKDNA